MERSQVPRSCRLRRVLIRCLPLALLQAGVAGAQVVLASHQSTRGDSATLSNDPSASVDTPLCGRQARDANAIADTLLPSRLAASGACAGFACYDPLTATYIGADGFRHVCR